jgi:hypothetical protein
MAVFTLSAAGSTPIVPISAFPPAYSSRSETGGGLLPGIIVTLSAGAVLTYSVEVTGDQIDAVGHNPATGHWNGFDTMTDQTVSANGTLGGRCSGIRCTITSYTSGSLTFQVVQ